MRYNKKTLLRQTPTTIPMANILWDNRVKKEESKEFERLIVFDPAVGTGTILALGKSYTPKALFVGWDIDDEILEIANEKTDSINIVLEQKSILHTQPVGKAHVIISEPPYGYADDAQYKHKYSKYIIGRSNLIVGFMLEMFKALHKKGEMVLLLPVTVLTGPAFNLLRRAFDDAYINNVHIIGKLNDPDDDLTPPHPDPNVPRAVVSISHEPLVSTSKLEDHRQSVSYDDGFEQVIWTDQGKKFKDFMENYDTLNDLGYKVSSGPFLWDRNRERLRASKVEGSVRILWPHTIYRGKYSNKPDYAMVEDEKLLEGPAIVMKRTLNKDFKPHFMLVEEGETYLVENHVLVIRPTNNPEMEVEELYRTLEDSYYMEEQGEKVQAVNAMTPQLRILCPNQTLSPKQLQYMVGINLNESYNYEAKHNSGV